MPVARPMITRCASGRTPLGGEARLNALNTLFDKRTLLWSVLAMIQER
jgi:hypothetical protein